MIKPIHIAAVSILSLFTCLLISSAAIAQRLPFKNYTTADGLPGSIIRDITQDKYGYIWINTDGGVARYDGVTFRNYTAEDSLSYVFRDSSGYVYLSGPGGLWRIAGDQRVWYPSKRILGPMEKVHYAKDGTLWFWHDTDGSTKYAGLSKIVNDHLEEYPDSLIKLPMHINLLAEDHQGNLWITLRDERLFWKYAIHKFLNKAFTEEVESFGFSKDWDIEDIIGDRYGNLWLFGHKHVGEKWRWGTFKLAKGRLVEYSDSTELHLRKGLLDDEGNLWLLASKYDPGSKIRRPAGVVKVVEDTLQWFTKRDGLASDEVGWIFPGKAGTLWFIGRNVVCKYQNGKFQNITGNWGWSEAHTSRIESLIEDSKDRVWIAWWMGSVKRQKSSSIGIAVIANGKIENYTSEQGIVGEYWMRKRNPIEPDMETLIWEDNYGNIWFQTNKALFRVVNGQWHRYDQKNGLAGPLSTFWDGAIFFQDREGNVWIGTQGGLSKLADQSYERYTKEDGLTSNFVWSPYQDKKGRIWVKAEGQANFMTGDKIEKFDLIRDDVLGFLEDGFGNMYFNVGSRVSKFDGKQLQYFELPHYAPVFRQDDSGNLWLGECCGDGVSKFDGKKVQHYTAKDGLINRSVRSILEDFRGHLWFVSHAGLSEFDGTKFRNYSVEKGELDPSSWTTCSVDQRKHVWLIQKGVLRDLTDPSEPVRQLPDLARHGAMISFWDREGNNWLGMYGGLAKIRCDDYQTFTTKDGLPGNRIFGIAQDSLGHIWVGTEKGIGVYDGVRFHHYNLEHGLEPMQINGNSYVDKNGNVWFGSVAGLIKVNVARALEKIVPPRIHIKSLQIDTLHISPRENLEFKHSRNDVVFSYLGLWFKNEDAIRYQYFLEGYDESWSEATDEREVRYTNLASDDYVFKVKAIIAPGIESEIASFAFAILPPFWKTWWFIALSSLSTLLVGYIVYRQRVNAKLEKARILNELQAARDMQMGLMPQSDPAIPGFDISGNCKPAEEVGGDYFDYVWLDEKKTKFGIAIVDVSGKAMKGAMTAAMTSGMIYSEIGNGQSPRIILQKINKPMYLKTDRQIFTTMSFAVIDTRSKTLTFSNAGQAQPILKRNGEIQYIKVEGMHLPLGVKQEVDYGEVTVQLQPDDVVIFYTDGLPEAMNEKNELFDFERLETTIRHLPPSIRAAEVIETLLKAVGQFSAKAKQHDDMTVVVTRVL